MTVTTPNEAIVLVDTKVDPSHFMLTGIDTSKKPLFAIGEVAKFFFAMTTYWIRWVENQGKLTLDGVPVAQERTESNIRRYTLSDVELMAHAMAQNGVISGVQLHRVLSLVSMEAKIYNYL